MPKTSALATSQPNSPCPRNCAPTAATSRKQSFVLAGIELLPLIFERFDISDLKTHKASGASIEKGDVLATVQGSARTLLTCERVSLNFLQRLSGVATLARQHVDAVAGTNVKVLDTRKTTPGVAPA